MIVLLSQIFFCLIIAALLGALVAWFVRRNMAQRRETAIQQGWKDQMRQVELDRDRSIHTLAAEIEKLKNLKPVAAGDVDAEDYDNLVTSLQGQVAEREDAITELRNEIQSLRSDLTEARNTSVQLETELLLKKEQDQQSDLAANDAALAELKEKIRSRDETIIALRDALARQNQQRDQAADDTVLAELNEKIRSRDETIAALRDDLARQIQRDEVQRGEQDKQLRSAMDDAIRWQEKYEAAADKLVQRKTGVVVIRPETTEPADDLLSYREPATESGTEKRERAISDRIGSVLSHPGGHKDKLQEVRGIGPVLERKLNDIGIYHFKQIAEFTADDIARVSNELGKFAGRIQRDEWVSQAQSLHRKYHQQNS